MQEAQLMKGRVVLITGASRGIGAATARLFARHGALVGVNYNRNSEEAMSVVQAVEDLGGKAIAIQASVDNSEQIQSMVTQVEEQLGPIDTLVLNAVAIKAFTSAPFYKQSWQSLQDMVMGELAGIYFPAQVVAPLMMERKRGSIVAISSNISRRPTGETSAHAAGKASVDAFVRAMATELGPYNIRVNSVAPGMVETQASEHVGDPVRQMIIRGTPMRRLARPEDVAGMILLLAADEASFTTGNYISVSGGAFMP